MSIRKPDVELQVNSLSATSLKRLKWCTTIAIVGFPVLVQILGAMMLYSKQSPVLKSGPILAVFGVAMTGVIGAGLYAVSNRVFLRFAGANRGLQEWESKTQADAFVFSYRIISRAVLTGFLGVSVLGGLQFFNLIGWIDFEWGQSIALNIEAIAAISAMTTYLVFLLPTLFIAWTLSPLAADE